MTRDDSSTAKQTNFVFWVYSTLNIRVFANILCEMFIVSIFQFALAFGNVDQKKERIEDICFERFRVVISISWHLLLC